MLTEAQRQARRKHIGASDVPALLNLSPYMTPQDVYWSKVANLPDRPTEAMELGNWLEPLLVEWAAKETGLTVRRGNRFRVSRGVDGGVLACNVDSWLGQYAIAEAKLVMSPERAEQCGDAGSDELPADWIAQAQTQMYVTGAPVVYFPVAIVLHRSIERRLYRVERADESDLVGMAEFARDWWRQHVVAKVAPDPSAPAPLAVLKSLPRQPQTIELPADTSLLIDDYQALAEELRRCEAAKEEAHRRLLEALGPFESGVLPDGTAFGVRQQRNPPKTDFKRMKIDGVFDTYCTQGASAHLWIKRPQLDKLELKERA